MKHRVLCSDFVKKAVCPFGYFFFTKSDFIRVQTNTTHLQ